MIKALIKKTVFYKYYLERKIKEDRKSDIERSKAIRGPLIDKYLPKDGIGAELGVLKGDFSRILLDFSNARELHLVDPWYFLESDWLWSGGNTSTVDAVCEILKKNKPEINSKRMFVHIQDDLNVLRGFEDHYFDWVYIDSSHEYEHTKKELDILKQKVKANGIICGDDWRPDETHRHHGVFKAVKEFMVSENYELIYASENDLQWFIKKK